MQRSDGLAVGDVGGRRYDRARELGRLFFQRGEGVSAAGGGVNGETATRQFQRNPPPDAGTRARDPGRAVAGTGAKQRAHAGISVGAPWP
jgi:hypothetical protein